MTGVGQQDTSLAAACTSAEREQMLADIAEKDGQIEERNTLLVRLVQRLQELEGEVSCDTLPHHHGLCV